MTLIDLFKAFHNVAVKKNLSQSERVLYYTLLGEWNSRKRPDKFKITRAEIGTLTGLTLSAVDWSLEKLNHMKLIHTKGTPTGLNVRLNPIGTPSQHEAENKPILRARENPKEIEIQRARANEEKLITEAMENAPETSKYHGMTLAQMLEARRKAKSID